MAVTITNEELDLLNKNGITDEDVKATVERYRNEGLDDNAIRQKVEVKLQTLGGTIVTPELKDKKGNVITPQNEEFVGAKGQVIKKKFRPASFVKSLGKGFVHGVSSLGTGLGRNVVNPLREKIGKKPLTDYEIENIYGKFLGLKEDGGAYKTGKVAGEIAPYFLLPEARVAQLGTVGNAALTGAYQGALGSGLSSVAEKGFDAKENLKDIAIGTATGGLLGGAIGKGGQVIARNQRAKNIAKRRATPLADRMTEEQLNRLTDPKVEQNKNAILDYETMPNSELDYRTLTDNELELLTRPNEPIQIETIQPEKSQINQQIADNINNKINNTLEKIKNHENTVLEINQKYGGIDNLRKELAMQMDEYGRVSDTDMQQIFDRYLAEQRELANDPYFDYASNIDRRTKKMSATWEKTPKKYTQQGQEQIEEVLPITQKKNVVPTRSVQQFNDVVESVPQQLDEVIPEQVAEATQTGKMKQSTLAQKANKSDEVAQSIQENPPLYEAINNAETITQAQSEIAQNADKVHTDIVKKLVDGDKDFSALDVEKTRQLFSELQKQGRFDEATELLELTSKQGSKLGQAVQAFSLWSKTTPDGAMLYAQKLLDKYNKGVKKNLQKRLSKKELRDIGETFQKLNESGLTGRELEVETAKAMKKVFKVVPKTFAQKLDGYRYINMLLSPQSRIKDFILTAKNASDTAIDESIAGGLDYLRTLGSKDKTRYISANPFAGTKAWLQGAKKGFKEGLEDVRYGINTSRSGEVGRYGLPNTPTFKEANFEGGLLDRAKTLIGNPLGSAEKLLRYTLQVPDRMFFEARYASSLANQMKARGVTEPTQDMINRAVEEAKRAVFQEDRLVTKRLSEAAQLADIPIEALENVIGLPQGTLPSASKGLAPFVKTPTNVIAQGAEGLHGLGSGGLQLSKAGNNPELIREAELLMGRGIRGLGELGLGYAVGKNVLDNIKTNIGEEDYYKNEITGLQPSSLVIGDKAISLQNMQNNLPFFTGVGLGQRGLGKAFTNTTDIIAEMPALKALGDLYNINKEANYIAKSEDPDKELLKKGSRAARSLGANYLTTLIPVGGW